MLIVVEYTEMAPRLYGLSGTRKYHFTGVHHDFIHGSRCFLSVIIHVHASFYKRQTPALQTNMQRHLRITTPVHIFACMICDCDLGTLMENQKRPGLVRSNADPFHSAVL